MDTSRQIPYIFKGRTLDLDEPIFIAMSGDNNSNILTFVFAKTYNEIDLSEYEAQLYLNGDFISSGENVVTETTGLAKTVSSSKITVKWLIADENTQTGTGQGQFNFVNSSGSVWKSYPFDLKVESSLTAEETETNYPNVLTDHTSRILDLEEKYTDTLETAETAEANSETALNNANAALAYAADVTNKVDKTTTIAGVDLQDNITANELKAGLSIDEVDNTSDEDKPVSTAQQTALDLKADLASPTFTGTPLTPTADAGTNTQQIASTEFVKTAIDNAVSTVYKYKGTVADYTALLAVESPSNGDVYNVTAKHETEPIFPAGANLAYVSSTESWDYLGGVVDLSGKVDKVTTGDKKQVYGVNASNTQVTYDIGGANGVTPLNSSSKIPTAYKYLAPITLSYDATDEEWDWDYSTGDNAKITMAGSEATQDINITNVSSGDIGSVTVIGGQLTLPSNSVLSSDFGYLTAVGSQYYRYSFYYNGTDFEWSRTVLGDE